MKKLIEKYMQSVKAISFVEKEKVVVFLNMAFAALHVDDKASIEFRAGNYHIVTEKDNETEVLQGMLNITKLMED